MQATLAVWDCIIDKLQIYGVVVYEVTLAVRDCIGEQFRTYGVLFYAGNFSLFKDCIGDQFRQRKE